MIKACRGGYDGKGNLLIKSKNQLNNLQKYFNENNIMVEQFINFKMEISLLVVRSINNVIITYPVVENIHENNILRMTIIPARISDKLRKEAEKIGKTIVNILFGAGVYCIEMFVTQDDHIIVNEIAPRVHNSGHYTLQSTVTSQFEQHLRAILGLKLGSTKLLHNTLMYNILGIKNFYGAFKLNNINKKRGVFIKLYNKQESRPYRKLGHINIIDIDNNHDVNFLLRKLNIIKKSLLIKPTLIKD